MSLHKGSARLQFNFWESAQRHCPLCAIIFILLMKGYLGEFELSENPFANYTKEQWAMKYIEMYGQIAGKHHKQWVLDQVARILKGMPIIVKEARWKNGHTEMRFSEGKPTKEYWDWVKEMKAGEDGPETYHYDAGVSP